MNDLQRLKEWTERTPTGYSEYLLRQAITDAKEALGEKRTKQIIAEEMDQ